MVSFWWEGDRAGALRQGFANFVRLQVFAEENGQTTVHLKEELGHRNNSIKTGVEGLCVAG